MAEVGRLVALLHAAPRAAHAEVQAVHAAATSRPVEDLVQLIGGFDEVKVKVKDESLAAVGAAARGAKPVAVRRPGNGDLLWLCRAVAVLVLLCGAAHFPLDWVDTPRHGLAASLGVPVLCLLAGGALWWGRSPAVAAVAVVVPGTLAAAHLVGTHVDSAVLAYVRQAGGAVSPLPALAACAATLAALTALAVSLARRRRGAGARDAVPDPVRKVNSLRL